MDTESIKEWVKPYRDTVEQQFSLNEEARQVVNNLFERIEQMAAACPDQMAFSNQFLKSELYTEYTQLFTKFQKQINMPEGVTTGEAFNALDNQSKSSMAKEYAKSMAKQKANEVISQMLPDEINRLRWGGARTLPVIGPVIQWIDNIKWLRRLFGK